MSRLMTKWLYAQRKLRSAWASAQSDQSLRCALRTKAFFMRTAKTLIRLGGCAGWSDQTGRMPRQIWVFAGRTCHFVGFVMRRLLCGRLTPALKCLRRQIPKFQIWHVYRCCCSQNSSFSFKGLKLATTLCGSQFFLEILFSVCLFYPL